MTCYKNLTLSMYLQYQLNYEGTVLIIDIEYYFLTEE